MKRAGRYIFLPVLILVLISLALSCITIKMPGGSSSTGNTQGSGSSSTHTRPHPPVRTGDITNGTKADVAAQTIGTSGGTVAVSKPGDPLDGFVISVAPSSFSDSRNFKISSAPITKHSFGSDINPISPMITVENGGVYSEEPMYVRVPVKVPAGNFAMGFIYDEKTKQLEGLPLAGADSESITIATRHFSNFFVSMIEKALLSKDTDSGFRPGIDDWQFINNGSVLTPGGNCEGQSLSAMWYYCTQPDGKDLCLYGRYDNNGKKPETPNLQEDDSLGYRFCSVIQAEMKFSKDFWRNAGGKNLVLENNNWVTKDVAGIGDEGIFNLFSYSIRATNEPQEVAIWTKDGNHKHAMIVYKVVGNALYVADPNYPRATDRKIIYYAGEGKFKPYNSGANRKEIEAGNAISYDTIFYYGKTTILPWSTISQRWTEFKAGTIGNDKFPAYQVNVVDDGGQIIELKDGFVTKNSKLRAAVAAPFSSKAYRDGILLTTDADKKYDLKPGNNELGFYILKVVGNDEQYVDFKYINVKSDVDTECKTPPPANIMAILQKTTKFSCNLLNLPTDIVGSGSMQKWVPGFKFTKHFYVPGNSISLGGDGSMPITWSGTTFSGGGSIKGYPDKLTGSVCYIDGKVMVSFDYQTNDPKDNLKFSIKNLPCDPERLTRKASEGPPELIFMSTDAPIVKKYVTKLEWTSHEERPERNAPPEVWDAYLKSADWTKQCGFDIFFH